MAQLKPWGKLGSISIELPSHFGKRRVTRARDGIEGGTCLEFQVVFTTGRCVAGMVGK